MLNFLSFLVLLYVSGHSKQKKKFSKFFWKFYKCFSKPGGKFYFWKNVEFLEFLGFTLRFRKFQAKKNFFKIFLTDRKISSPINYMIWWGIFSISQKIFEKKFFAWNVLKHKVKPKNSRKSTFFQKLKFPPYFWKTLVKFSSPKCSLWYAVIFLSPREGKFKPS